MAYPSLVITYLGQAAYLMINPDNYATTFYACIPSPVYWPVFVIAVLAAIVASQVKKPQLLVINRDTARSRLHAAAMK